MNAVIKQISEHKSIQKKKPKKPLTKSLEKKKNREGLGKAV